ncbi:MAG: response regulator transcription factor [Alphaproteobacteria bacterium]|nr:response regulator transcription factor [Alphaproteobacteria bacterium]MBU0860063.1 response regulator transcription factor [Alphaproteobacteria bacterium]
MKLLLADDHTLFREALVQYIERAEPDAVVLLARDMNEVMILMEDKPEVDLILLDLRMPGMNGLQGLRLLREKHPETRVALLSGMAEKEHVEEAIALGASAYFPKTLSATQMMKGIRRVVTDGEQYIAMDHNSNDIMPSHFGHDRRARERGAQPGGAHGTSVPSISELAARIKMTPREQEVLGYLLRGASNKEIANALDLQVVTVKLHVRGICRKLNAKNRTQAVLRAQEMGLAAVAG